MILHRLVCMGDRHLAQGVVPGKRFRCEEYLEERVHENVGRLCCKNSAYLEIHHVVYDDLAR